MNLVLIKQLPVLEEQIKVLSAEIQKKIDNALSLKCTEESKVEVKNVRADLRKTLAEYEEKRKEVKNKIMKPYNDFEALYKVHISNKLNAADGALKAKIDEIENAQKAAKEKEVREYFEEYRESLKLYFVTFESAGINITLTATVKALKEQAKAFLDRVADDVKMILNLEQEQKAEIFAEYKKTLNATHAITTVTERLKAIEAERAKVAEFEQAKEAEQEVVNKVEVVAPPVEEKEYTLSFKVTATKDKLQALKNFLNAGGYKYE